MVRSTPSLLGCPAGAAPSGGQITPHRPESGPKISPRMGLWPILAGESQAKEGFLASFLERTVVLFLRGGHFVEALGLLLVAGADGFTWSIKT